MLGVGFSLAVGAGFFAAMASVFSKLAFEDDGTTLKHTTCLFLAESLCTNVRSPFQGQDIMVSPHLPLLQVVLFLRVVCFLLLLLSNVFMWTLFVKALQGCGSTVEAAVANTGSNFVFTVTSIIHVFYTYRTQ